MIFRMLFVNLALTVFVEGVVTGLLFRSKRIIYCSFLCNLLTNPVLNLAVFAALTFWGKKYYFAVLIPMETAVVIAEAYIYHVLCAFTAKKSLLISLLANAVSFVVGLML